MLQPSAIYTGDGTEGLQRGAAVQEAARLTQSKHEQVEVPRTIYSSHQYLPGLLRPQPQKTGEKRAGGRSSLGCATKRPYTKRTKLAFGVIRAKYNHRYMCICLCIKVVRLAVSVLLGL